MRKARPKATPERDVAVFYWHKIKKKTAKQTGKKYGLSHHAISKICQRVEKKLEYARKSQGQKRKQIPEWLDKHNNSALIDSLEITADELRKSKEYVNKLEFIITILSIIMFLAGATILLWQ